MDQQRLNIAHIRSALRPPDGGDFAGTSDFDFNPEWRPEGPLRLRAASVLVPLIARGAGLNVVLTRRAARLRHHPGQIAFPGGKQDPGDPTPLHAALREAREEIGLDPASVSILGSFDRHETVTRFSVTPFVGLVTPGFEPRIDPSEVEEVFEVPLAFLVDPAHRRRHSRAWGGGRRIYLAIPYGPYYIWGATARMLATLGDLIGAP
ncbi:NUDIX hydrolase [Amaricoccus solimangrovi]|uniref:CoA pyrophosphatase n=1 Tax=Amaricoccus solimangrovi TaxID=2589815 RepID=A0A501WXD3_9RHOB|nr:CoA pyrophosphatase [Amaricoccus solimangrovi]TPE52097.1 CoA pyrophosphatase [Amaricoccus solimangrovi]